MEAVAGRCSSSTREAPPEHPHANSATSSSASGSFSCRRYGGCSRLFDALLPSLMLEGMMGMAYAKEILIRRGVFRITACVGVPGPWMTTICVRLTGRGSIEPHLIWHRH